MGRIAEFIFRRRGGNGWHWTDIVTWVWLIGGLIIMFGPAVWLAFSSFKRAGSPQRKRNTPGAWASIAMDKPPPRSKSIRLGRLVDSWAFSSGVSWTKLDLGGTARPRVLGQKAKASILTDLAFEINSAPFEPGPAGAWQTQNRAMTALFHALAGVGTGLRLAPATRRFPDYRGKIWPIRSVSRGKGSPQSQAAIKSPPKADQLRPREA